MEAHTTHTAHATRRHTPRSTSSTPSQKATGARAARGPASGPDGSSRPGRARAAHTPRMGAAAHAAPPARPNDTEPRVPGLAQTVLAESTPRKQIAHKHTAARCRATRPAPPSSRPAGERSVEGAGADAAAAPRTQKKTDLKVVFPPTSSSHGLLSRALPVEPSYLHVAAGTTHRRMRTRRVRRASSAGLNLGRAREVDGAHDGGLNTPQGWR